MGVPVTDPTNQLKLPPGFRFYPTDEELMVQYLCRKVAGHDFSLQIIGDVDLYKLDPWELPSKAMFGEKEWYFFSPRDRKYPNGTRPNRVAGSGYWKATGTDKVITSEGRKVGIKKALVFYVGKAPRGSKTNWIMHEYRLSDPPKKNSSLRLDDWVLCRIYKKNSSLQKTGSGAPSSDSSSSSQFDDVLESLPEMSEQFLNIPDYNSCNTFEEEDQKLNIQKYDSGNYDWASIAAFGMQNLMNNNNNNNSNPLNLTSIDPPFSMNNKFLRSPENDVQIGIRSQRIENSGYVQQNPDPFLLSTTDPFAIRYPTQPGSFGFRQ